MKPLTPASPHAIIMIGIPGAGKTTFANRFAETFNTPIVSQTSLQREYGLNGHQANELRARILEEFLKTNRTVVIDGGFEAKEKRDELVRKLVKSGYRPLTVWVQTDTAEAFRRAHKPHPTGSGLSSETFDQELDIFQAPGEREKMVVISGKHTYTSQLKIVLKQLAVADHSQPRVTPSTEEKEQASKIMVKNRNRNRGTFLR